MTSVAPPFCVAGPCVVIRGTVFYRNVLFRRRPLVSAVSMATCCLDNSAAATCLDYDVFGGDPFLLLAHEVVSAAASSAPAAAFCFDCHLLSWWSWRRSVVVSIQQWHVVLATEDVLGGDPCVLRASVLVAAAASSAAAYCFDDKLSRCWQPVASVIQQQRLILLGTMALVATHLPCWHLCWY